MAENKPICSIEGCGKPLRVKGLCKSHYNQQYAKTRKRKPCSIEGCEKLVLGRSLCSMHYTRWRLHGDINVKLKNQGELIAFVTQAAKFDGEDCLLWPFGLTKQGYPDYKMSGKPVGAHRAVCLLVHGKPPSPKHEAAHRCGNRLCVNPKHLRWATTRENSADKRIHGTQPMGETASFSRLKEQDVREIRRLSADKGYNEIARLFELSPGHVWLIVNRRQWKHI